MAAVPARRRLLEPDHVGVESAEPLDGEAEPLLQRLVVARELREDPGVEEIERDEAERERRRARGRSGTMMPEPAPRMPSAAPATISARPTLAIGSALRAVDRAGAYFPSLSPLKKPMTAAQRT